MLTLLRRVFLLCAVLLCVCRVDAQTSFSSVVVFGDSLSDTGNIARLVQNATGGPVGIRFPSDLPSLGSDYTDGRFTDGSDTQPPAQAYFGVWIEQLAASFPGKPAVKDALDGGTNYAYGDATTANGTTTVTEGPVSINLHNMGQQVADYLANVGSHSAAAPDAGTLFVLWGGANDLYQASSAGTDLTAAANTAISNELALVQQLVNAGGTSFMIPNLPPLGAVPNQATTPTAAGLNAAAGVFAQGLAQGIANLQTALKAQGITITVYQPNIFNLFDTFATNPMSVGLGNVTAKAQNVSGSPDTYLIWDGLHPTTTGHHFVAATAASLLTPLVGSATTLAVPAAAIAGAPVTLTATVKSSTASNTPSGLVTFFNGTAAIGSAALNTSGVGTAPFTPTTAAGPYSITAVYAGDTFNGISASAPQPLAVLSAPVVTTTVLTSSGASINPGASVTLTATVTPAVATYGPATGTVTFLNGTTTLGTGTLSNGVATFNTAPLTTPGALSLTASYAATGPFGGSTSAALSETVVAPGFTATATPTTLTLSSGSSGTSALTYSAVGGYTGTVALSCGTLPAHFSCAFSAAQLSSQATTSTLTIATNAATAALALPARPGAWSSPQVVSATLLLPGTSLLFLFGLRRRLHPRVLDLCLAMTVTVGALLGLTGCGSSTNNNAATGTYTVPVLFTPSSGSAQTVNLTVTVQ